MRKDTIENSTPYRVHEVAGISKALAKEQYHGAGNVNLKYAPQRGFMPSKITNMRKSFSMRSSQSSKELPVSEGNFKGLMKIVTKRGSSNSKQATSVFTSRNHPSPVKGKIQK